MKFIIWYLLTVIMVITAILPRPTYHWSHSIIDAMILIAAMLMVKDKL